MKTASWIVAAVGLLTILAGVYGRFHGAQTLTVGSWLLAPATFLLLGNTFLVLAVFLAVACPERKQQT